MSYSIKESFLWHIAGMIKRKLQQKKRDRIKKKKVSNFNSESEYLLHIIASVFNKKGVVFWLEFGSLLGYYRENDFLKHDDDFDFGVRLEDAQIVRDILTASGFELIRYYNELRGGGMEECYRYQNMHTTIDFYYFDFTDKGVICSGFKAIKDMRKKANLRKEVPFSVREMVFPSFTPIPITFKGENMYVPDNCKEHLAAHYGPGFMIPNTKFDNSEANNVTLYDYETRPAIGWMKYGYDDLI